MEKIAVVLFNLGGPDSLSAVQPFLFNLFSDPDIFNIPIGQRLFASLISKLRAPKVVKEYELIGGKSPINSYTETQRLALENSLRGENINCDVFIAMRYWHPLTEEIVKKVEANNYSKIILLPLYPHYSITTTGSSFNEWNRHYKGDKSKLIYINHYFDNDNYISAINERIDETLLKFNTDIRSNVVLVFSAHGTPVSLVKKGDLYNEHIKSTVEHVMKKRNYSHNHVLCYQSKVGPVKWLEPSTDKMIINLAEQNKKNLLIVPVSFVSDHVETLFELNIEYRHVAEENDIKNYIVMTGLNESHVFINALTQLVKNEL